MMWTNDDIAEVLEHLRVQGNDDARFEAKSCARTIGTSVWESVSAFANTKGGVLLLGISEDGDFSPVPGFDANHIASQFMDGMGDGNPQGARLTNPPEYDVSRCEQNGLSFLVIDIHENGIQHKPCYLTARGPQTGGYRRMDDKDLRLSPTEVFEMTHALTPSSADRMVVPEADVSDLNAEAVDRVLAEHRNSKALRGTDTRLERMTRLNMVNKVGEVRLAGLLAAGQYPQQYYPKLIIDVVEFGGRRGAFEGPLEPFDGVLGIRAGGRGLEYVFGDSGYRFAQPGFVRVRPVEDQPDEPVPAINASRLVESRTLLRVARRQLAETENLLTQSFSRLPRFSKEDASRMEARRHDIENKMYELRELIGEQSYDLNSIESKGQTR